MIIGQAPGARVHESGIPWRDDSGNRLREWTGLSDAEFYNPDLVALVPIGFCYSGTGTSGDLPPRRECAPLWRDRVLALLPQKRLTLLVGTYAHQHYLKIPARETLTETVRGFCDYRPEYFPLPHPSWRSGIWMKRNPWSSQSVLPALRKAIAKH